LAIEACLPRQRHCVRCGAQLEPAVILVGTVGRDRDARPCKLHRRRAERGEREAAGRTAGLDLPRRAVALDLPAALRRLEIAAVDDARCERVRRQPQQDRHADLALQRLAERRHAQRHGPGRIAWGQRRERG
jgi:hypothetical protein